MKRYRIVLDFVSTRTNTPYFRIECSEDNGVSWNRVGGRETWTGEVAHQVVRNIVSGEGEYVVIPVNVERFSGRY